MSILALSRLTGIVIMIASNGLIIICLYLKFGTRQNLLERIQAVLYLIFGRSYQCGCGHRAKKKTIITIDGHQGVYTLGRKREYCPQCWTKAAIKCAWCGDVILPGDPITLYSPTKEDFKIPEHAVIYKRTPRPQLVGCLGWNCAETGADQAGFWIMPGKVQRVLSPMEMIMTGMNGGDCNPLIISDLSDPKETILVPDEIAKPGE